jgi:DNA-nicking Smr family endonuclease
MIWEFKMRGGKQSEARTALRRILLKSRFQQIFNTRKVTGIGLREKHLFLLRN